MSLKDPRDPIVTMRVNILPRGSGNRAFARRLAEQFRAHEELAPHCLRVVAGSSSVMIELRPSLELMLVITRITFEEQRRKAEAAALADQPMLPGLAAG